MKKIYMPSDYPQFEEEYGKALELLVPEGSTREFYDTETIVKRTEERFEKLSTPLKSDSPEATAMFAASTGLLVKNFAEVTIECAVNILEVNGREEPIMSLREVSAKYLHKTNDGGLNNSTMLNKINNIGVTIRKRKNGRSDAPYPFYYLGELISKQIKARNVFVDGSIGGLISNIIVLLVVIAGLCLVWMFPPIKKFFELPIFYIVTMVTPFAMGVFVWKKFQDNLGYFSGCLGYILAALLGGSMFGIVLGVEKDMQAQANAEAIQLAVTAVTVIFMLIYWIPSLYRNLRFTVHYKTAFPKYNEAQKKTGNYLNGILDAVYAAKALANLTDPEYKKTYDYVTKNLSVTRADGTKVSSSEVWKFFTDMLYDVQEYYENAHEIWKRNKPRDPE